MDKLVCAAGNSCIRFEKLREGIAGYEKILILKGQTAASANKTVRKLWQSLEQHLKTFTQEHSFDERKITADVDKGKQLVAALTDALIP